MGTRNDDISLILAKAKKQGFLPDVSDSEVDILRTEAKNLFRSDALNFSSGISAAAGSAWIESQIENAFTPPVAANLPTVAYNSVTTTALSSPKIYKPLKVGTGVFTPTWDGQDDPNFQIAPGLYETANGGSADLTILGKIKPGGDAQFARWPVFVSFMTSADVIEVFCYGGVTNTFSIMVNDRWVTEFTTTRGVSSAGYLTTITLPSVGVRKITLFDNGVMGISEVRVSSAHTIWKPKKVNSNRMAVVGDSFTGGAGAGETSGAAQHEAWPARLSRLLNAEPILAGIGGTGLTAGGINGSGESRTYAGRIPLILSFNPDTVIITGSVNDPQSGAGCAVALESILDQCSNVPNVFVVGCVQDSWQPMNAILKTSTLAKGRKFIDMDKFMFGSGKAGAVTGNGNNDFWRMSDGTHPTLPAHKAIANEVFRGIATQYVA